MGFAAERFGIRPVALMGVVATGIAVIVASRAVELWQFYVLFFLAGVFGGGALSAPLMALVGSWFLRGAGLAIGITAAGQALGQGGVPFTGAFLIDALGWRGAMAAQGGITLVVLLPLTYFLKNAPGTGAKTALSDKSPSGLSNNAVTAWMSLAVVFCCICMAVPLMHLVPLIQGRGFAGSEASGVLFLMLMVAVLGRVAFGKLADIIGAIPTWLVASGWQTLLVFGFTCFESLNSFYVYAAFYGFGYAGVMTSLIVTARNLSAPSRRASTIGIVLAFAYIGHGIGGWQGGFFFDLTGGYQLTYDQC
jgi:MFS family permease